MDPKRFSRVHKRKYVGIVFQISGFNYFAPFSSPKLHDYENNGSIKKDNIFSLKMTKDAGNGKKILLGTIKLTNMVPISLDYINSYSIDDEKDKRYKQLLLDENKWISINQHKIQSKARALYYFKKNESKNKNKNNERIYNAILPFELIELHLRSFNDECINKK